MKIVINRCFGGYSLSEKAYAFLGKEYDGFGYLFDEERDNPQLVACVEQLGEAANGDIANLKVVEIPDDVNWKIDNYDGMETIVEVCRQWS